MRPAILLPIWLVVAAVAMAVQLGEHALLDADEGRNAAVAREMATTNDYVMPRYNGLPYLDKPVVFFAAEAAVMEVLGPTELAARLPAYLFTLATGAVLFWFARRIRLDPWVTTIVFLAMPLTIAFARTVIFDSALTFFVVVALVAFHTAIESRDARWSILAWAAMGLAMITKGPVTFVLVLLVVIPFGWWRGSVRLLFPLLGFVAFALVVAPWVWAVSQVVPEFLRYVLVTETAERMATKALQRTGPPWYFLPYLIAGALPWSIVLLFTWRNGWKRWQERDPALVFALLWLAVPLLFFSISQSKRPQYILPLMPAIALLIARLWNEARTRAAAVVLSAFGVLLLAAPLFLHRTTMKPELLAIADNTAVALGIAFLIGGVAALFTERRDLLLIALTLPVIALPVLTTPLMEILGERRSTRSFVEELDGHLTAETEIIGVEAFTGSMVFYLRRPMTIVTEDASEMTSNYLVRRYRRYITNPGSPLKPLPYFERSLKSRAPRVYVLRMEDGKRRKALESGGWRLVADGAHHVAYAR